VNEFAVEQKKTGNISRNVILRRVSLTNFAVEKQKVLYIMSRCLYACLIYPACKLYLFCTSFYRHLWSVWQYHFFKL